MKKLIFFVSIITLLLISCAMIPKDPKVISIFDDSIAVEKTAWISTGGIGTIVSYNGIKVNWDTKDFYKQIQIPAGNTSLEWDIYFRYGDTLYKANNVPFNYNFLAGKQYIFSFGFHPDDEYKDGKAGIRLYLYDMGEPILDDRALNYDYDKNTVSEMEKRLIGFFPIFKEQKTYKLYKE